MITKRENLYPNSLLTLQTFKHFQQMAFLASLKQIAGIESGSVSNSFMTEFFKLVLGTFSLPIDLPGTNYRRGIQV